MRMLSIMQGMGELMLKNEGNRCDDTFDNVGNGRADTVSNERNGDACS